MDTEILLSLLFMLVSGIIVLLNLNFGSITFIFGQNICAVVKIF